MLSFGSALIEVVGRVARPTGTATTAFTTSAQQDHCPSNDFRHVLLLVGLFVVPRAGLQAPFDVDLRALFQVLAGNLRHARPEHDVVPLGALLPLPRFVLVRLVGGERDLCDRGALRRVLHFRIFAQIADEDDFVNALGHECGLLRRVTIAETGRWKLWYVDRGGVTNCPGIQAQMGPVARRRSRYNPSQTWHPKPL